MWDNWTRTTRTTTQKGVKLTFNPPVATHFGGAQELIMKEAKKAIYAVLISSDVTYEELITVVTVAESLFNPRSLSYYPPIGQQTLKMMCR